MVAAIWIITLLLLGLCTSLAWGLATLLATDASWVLRVEPWLLQAPFAGWLESWWPQWLDAARAALQLTQTVLAWAGGAGPVLVWLLWGAMAFALLVLAGVLTLIVVLMRRHAPPAPPAPPPGAGVQAITRS